MKKFDLKKAILENKATFFSSLTEGYVEEAKNVSKEDKIAVIKEWVWYTCDEGQAKEDINKYNKMIDMYFADKNDVTKQDFKNIWNKVIEKYGVGDTGADSEAFPETWRDVQTGNLVNPDQVYEGEAAYEYEKGKTAGEEIEKKKMKMSELKGKIKKMVMAEVALDIDTMENAPKSEVDFLTELESMLSEESPMNDPRTQQVIDMLIDMEVDGETMEYILRKVGMEDQMANQLVNYPKDYTASLSEAKEDEEEEIEVTDDFSTEEPQGPGKIDVTQNADADLTGDKKSVQDNLEAALEAAKALGDDKLVTQIGNSLTFFTKQHVVK
jgi:hypothetical protein